MYKKSEFGAVIRLQDGAIIPEDPRNQDYVAVLEWIAEGNTLQGADLPSREQVEAALTAAIQKRLDDFAHTRNYDGILSACTYATSTVAKFKADGQACVNLRDATWSAAYNILAQVQAGTRPMPTSIADIQADLPALVWPA